MSLTGAQPTPQKCSLCGGWFQGPHYCPGHHPPYGFGAFPTLPLTEERVREIVRDELARVAAAASSPAPEQQGSGIDGVDAAPKAVDGGQHHE